MYTQKKKHKYIYIRWSQADSRRFEEKARCIEHFYSSFKISGHHVNGDLTLGEDIADMGGKKKISSLLLIFLVQKNEH